MFQKKWNLYFSEPKLKITTEGSWYLGGSVGTPRFKDVFITTKVNEWISQLELLSKIAAIEPQSSYCALTAGFKYQGIPDI